MEKLFVDYLKFTLNHTDYLTVSFLKQVSFIQRKVKVTWPKSTQLRKEQFNTPPNLCSFMTLLLINMIMCIALVIEYILLTLQVRKKIHCMKEVVIFHFPTANFIQQIQTKPCKHAQAEQKGCLVKEILLLCIYSLQCRREVTITKSNPIQQVTFCF